MTSARNRRSSRDLSVVTSFDLAAQMDIVFFAVLHSASRDLALALKQHLDGKLIVDADNAWLPGHYELAGLSEDITEGQWMANLLPESRVVRAFSHIPWPLFKRGQERPGYWGAGYAADDEVSAGEISQILERTGFVPIRAGTLAESRDLDTDGAVWSQLLTAAQTESALRRRS